MNIQQVTIFFLVPLLSTLAENDSENSIDAKRLAKIKALEKEKNKLYKQINDAIDDSVNNLKEMNDNNAREGINLISDLKNHLKVFNGTNTTGLYFKDKVFDTRRKQSGRLGQQGLSALDTGVSSEEDLSDRTKMKHKLMGKLENSREKGGDLAFKDTLYLNRNKNEKYRERYENRLLMKLKIQDWLKKQEDENEKLKAYLNRTQKKKVKTEKCPNFGIDLGKATGKKKRPPGKYPCCRKCCKASYLGCL